MEDKYDDGTEAPVPEAQGTWQAYAVSFEHQITTTGQVAIAAQSADAAKEGALHLLKQSGVTDPTIVGVQEFKETPEPTYQ